MSLNNQEENGLEKIKDMAFLFVLKGMWKLEIEKDVLKSEEVPFVISYPTVKIR
jgi:hypothetical protein